MAYADICRCELQFSMFGWSASYRLHFGFTHPCTASDIAACSAWAAQIDTPNVHIPATLGLLRSVHSTFDKIVATTIGGPSHLWGDLLIGDAVKHGGDNTEPTPSAGMSVQLEWVTGERGRGVNGRTYFPYFGGDSFEAPSCDLINPLVADAVESVCNAFAFYTPAVVGADLVVATRQRALSPRSVLDSHKVVATTVRRREFMHQRRRVEWRRRFSPAF